MTLPAPRFAPGLRLVAEGLAMRRGHRHLFAGLDLALASGGVLRLAGPNGSGKTTLIRLLAGFLKPEAGTIRWEGMPAEAEPALLIHYHGHREGLREALTPRENLAFAAALLGGEPGRIAPALATLGALPLADLPVHVLSAGQRRRVALARLLVAPRPVWLLDEPLAALDQAGQALIGALLAAHRAAGGLAVVATHQPIAVEAAILDLGARGAALSGEREA